MTSDSARPLVLLGVGADIAPLLEILRTCAAAGFARPVWFVHGAPNGGAHPFAATLRELAAAHADLHLDISYGRPRTTDVLGRDYQHNGRVSLATVKRLPAGADADYVLCGPPAFVADLYAGLIDWGVADVNIDRPGMPAPGEPADAAPATAITVRFAASGVTAPWPGTHDSLLALAEAHGLSPPFSCRNGICRTCECPLLTGDVAYDEEPMLTPEPGQVLLCCCKPVTDVTLDV